jgi:hypothetical protein
MEQSARLFNCALCLLQVTICSDCDRGNIYCGSTCSQFARADNHRIADKKYQKTFRGKQKHAERQRRYRQRKQIKVTDQGSHLISNNDLLLTEPKNDTKRLAPKDYSSIICHFCSKNCSMFLRRCSRNSKSMSSSWPSGP